MKIKTTLKALRAPFFITSILPVLLAGLLSVKSSGEFNLMIMLLCILGVLLIHGITNLTNEYFDFKYGIDKKGAKGMEHVLAENKLSKSSAVYILIIMFLILALIAAVLSRMRGNYVLILGLIGTAGGFFYTAPPIKYKYRGLGDIMVFILMGPLLITAAATVISGFYSADYIYQAVPAALLITAVLHGNNFRDIENDSNSGITTFAKLLGRSKSKKYYIALITIPYFYSILLVISKISSIYLLIVMLSLPKALNSIKRVLNDESEFIEKIDTDTVGIYILFLIYQIASLIIEITVI